MPKRKTPKGSKLSRLSKHFKGKGRKVKKAKRAGEPKRRKTTIAERKKLEKKTHKSISNDHPGYSTTDIVGPQGGTGTPSLGWFAGSQADGIYRHNIAIRDHPREVYDGNMGPIYGGTGSVYTVPGSELRHGTPAQKPGDMQGVVTQADQIKIEKQEEEENQMVVEPEGYGLGTPVVDEQPKHKGGGQAPADMEVDKPRSSQTQDLLDVPPGHPTTNPKNPPLAEPKAIQATRYSTVRLPQGGTAPKHSNGATSAEACKQENSSNNSDQQNQDHMDIEKEMPTGPKSTDHLDTQTEAKPAPKPTEGGGAAAVGPTPVVDSIRVDGPPIFPKIDGPLSYTIGQTKPKAVKPKSNNTTAQDQVAVGNGTSEGNPLQAPTEQGSTGAPIGDFEFPVKPSPPPMPQGDGRLPAIKKPAPADDEDSIQQPTGKYVKRPAAEGMRPTVRGPVPANARGSDGLRRGLNTLDNTTGMVNAPLDDGPGILFERETAL